MTKIIFTRLLMAFAVAFIAVQSIGCETTEGAGRDMEKAGEGIQDAAN